MGWRSDQAYGEAGMIGTSKSNGLVDEKVNKILQYALDAADLEVSAHMGYYTQEEVDQAWHFFKAKVKEILSE